MNYKEVITHIKTVDPESEFIAVAYNESDKHVYTYIINANEDLDINCHLEGGIPFRSDGVEDCLDIEEVISDISQLHFKAFDDSLYISGMVAEHMLFKLFPMLPDPEKIWTQAERVNFINLAKHHIEHTWPK